MSFLSLLPNVLNAAWTVAPDPNDEVEIMIIFLFITKKTIGSLRTRRISL